MYFNQLEGLEERIARLLKESRDSEFTDYLLRLQKRIADQKQQAVSLTDELNRVERMYHNNMQLRSRLAQMQQASQPGPAVVYQAVPQGTPRPTTQEVQVSQAVQPVQQPAQTAPRAVQPIPQRAQTAPQAMQPVPQPVQATPQPVQPVPQWTAKPKTNAEFAVGASVLSVVGSVFVLAALVMLGMYFMTGLAKGLILYAGCLLVMVLAEALVYRRFPKLGMTLSAVGMGGLYISTLVNYIVLKNFNQWVALGVVLLITLVVVILSRKRDAAVYRILGLAAMYVSVYMVLDRSASIGGLSQVEFVAISVFALVINVMCLCVPVKKTHTAIQIVHMALNTLFAVFVTVHWRVTVPDVFSSVAQLWDGPAFVAMSILAMQLIFVAQVRYQEKQTPDCGMSKNVGICVTYGISSFVYMLLVIITTNFKSMLELGSNNFIYLPHRLVSCVIVVVLCLLPIVMMRKRQEKWFSWHLLNLLIIAIEGHATENSEIFVCFAVLLLAGKLLSITKSPVLRVSDAIITTICCQLVLINWKDPWSLVLVAGLVISVLCISYWQTYFEVILLFTLAFFSSWHMLQMLKLPVFVGMMFLGMFIFNNVARWHGKGIQVLNWMALSGQVICYLLLINPVYRNSYLTYLCMLIFGVTTIVVCFQKTYHLDFDGKQLIMAAFLTYMGLVVRTGYPIVNSILLMVIALGCVAAGFIIQKKSVRIYGLVLSLVVCAKLVIYDFGGVNMLQKTILFFAVGVLALIIAGIYMVLERNHEKQQRQEANEA